MDERRKGARRKDNQSVDKERRHFNRRSMLGKLSVIGGAGFVQSAFGGTQMALLTISPTSGSPGTVIAATGTGFGKSESIRMMWDGVALNTACGCIHRRSTGLPTVELG